MSERQRGPSIKTTLHCKGCMALVTRDWSEYLENDDTDSGTTATCTADGANRVISSCYYSFDQIPEWCPWQDSATTTQPPSPELGREEGGRCRSVSPYYFAGPHECALSEGHDGQHCSNDGTGWFDSTPIDRPEPGQTEER